MHLTLESVEGQGLCFRQKLGCYGLRFSIVSKFVKSSLLPESLICSLGKMFVLFKLRILGHCSDLGWCQDI